LSDIANFKYTNINLRQKVSFR